MKIRILAYCIAALPLLFIGCRNDSEYEKQRLDWTTDSPLSIPYKVRYQRFERTNLIRNPSFESGRTFRLDSVNTSFAIDGWRQVGQNIQWVDTWNDSIYNADEVYSGRRAVKITRKLAYETDTQGDGILSDFIRVIPGNYSLSLFLKMEDVKPRNARLGTRIYDGVDISIRFYDRNKILMNPGYRFPQARQIVNNSFKALSFANYKEIKSFGWGRVIAKSHHFPFPEGDIPSDAHFARIFIGLKGSGTLWIDSVTFRYTDRNFSAAERMQIYTDTAFHHADVLIPTPKIVTQKESIIFHKPGMSARQMPVIIIPQHTEDETLLKAARLIQDAFRKNLAAHYRGDTEKIMPILSDRSNTGDSSLIISIGNTVAYNYYIDKLPVKEISAYEDGYFIASPPDRPNLVLLGANNSRGLYYAALTAVQMIDPKMPVFHNAGVIDYPDFPLRCFTVQYHNDANYSRYLQGFANELTGYKLNGVLVLRRASDNGKPDSPVGRTELLSVMPASGYLPPEDSTLLYNYPFTYNSNVSAEHNKYFIPPVFHNEMLDNSDYSGACSRVTYVAKPLYSGSSFFSLNTDVADIERFNSIMRAEPVFMDNSMLISTEWGHYGGTERYYPGKIRLFNLFEPYINTDIKHYLADLDSSVFVTNLPVNSEIAVIRMATAADFMWNTTAYSKELSLWKVLTNRYGAENAYLLVAYADKYSQLLEVTFKAEMNIQTARNLKTGQQYMAELTGLLADISYRLGSQSRLVMELHGINTGLRDRLNRQYMSMPAGK